MKAVREIMEKDGVTLDEIAYVGDDVIDLPVMRECGFAVAVGDARERVKAEAHYVTPNRGGRARLAMRSSSSLRPRACSTSASRLTSTRTIRFRLRWILARAGIWRECDVTEALSTRR